MVGNTSNFVSMFHLGSSPIDWCEPNYVHWRYVAEMFNTVSSLALLVLPMIGQHLHAKYFKFVNPPARYVYWSVMVVGITSMYFHSTLSLLGQLLDELSLLWMVVIGMCVWIPPSRLARPVQHYSAHIVVGLLSFAVLGTCLAFWKPWVNNILLMTFTIPITICMGYEVKLARNPTADTFCWASVIAWFIAVFVWLSDRVMCQFWLNAGFPYLHAIWHVLSAVAAYVIFVEFTYLDVTGRVENWSPTIAYAPEGGRPIFPYVRLNSIN